MFHALTPSLQAVGFHLPPLSSFSSPSPSPFPSFLSFIHPFVALHPYPLSVPPITLGPIPSPLRATFSVNRTAEQEPHYCQPRSRLRHPRGMSPVAGFAAAPAVV
ncbi:unnamed protein product [Closterium sp. NIES-53]